MRRPSVRKTRLRTAAQLMWLWSIVLAVVLVVGCTVTEKNHRILSFFFDGVPDPSARAGTGERTEGGKRVVITMHAPYAEEKCDACHRTRYRPTRNDGALCLECHQAVLGAYPRMHGAVEANACLWCHNPHESAHPALLRDADRKVCGQCHTPSMLSATRVPEHADAARGCLECHSGHGGTTASFLKPGDAPAPAGSR